LQVVGAQAVTAADMPFESLVLFSSTSAVWSQTGSAHYASGNSFLDALALQQNHMGKAGTSLQLGPFAHAGMAAGHVQELSALGLNALNPGQLHDAVLLAGVAPQQLFVRLNASKFAQLYNAKGRWSLLDWVLLQNPARQKASGDINTSGVSGNFIQHEAEPSSVKPLNGHTSQRVTSSLSLTEVTQVIKKAAMDILGDPAREFDEFPTGGFDSLSAVELSSTVGRVFDLELPGTLVYDYPSMSSMAQHVFGLLVPHARSEHTVGSPPAILDLVPSAEAYTLRSQPIYVIEASRMAMNPHGIADAVGIVPYDRWDLEAPRVSYFFGGSN